MGVAYEEGLGVAKDPAAAFEWFRRAAEQGLAPAQFDVGLAYEFGRGVKRDEAVAAEWYRKAALHGFGLAENNLAALYVEGHGVRRDYVEASFWLDLAVNHISGDQLARTQRLRQFARGQLKRAQIDALEQREQQWNREHPPAPETKSFLTRSAE
jgi:hypothetical protein